MPGGLARLQFIHGVGPIRRYVIGAVLLDKDDLTRRNRHSRELLIQPEKSEREGYVPNVVRTCGAMKVGDWIVLTYAISDTFSTFATVTGSCKRWGCQRHYGCQNKDLAHIVTLLIGGSFVINQPGNVSGRVWG